MKRIWIVLLISLGLALIALVIFSGEHPQEPLLENVPVARPEVVAPTPEGPIPEVVAVVPRKEIVRLDLSVQLEQASVAPEFKPKPVRAAGRSANLSGTISGQAAEPVAGAHIKFVAGLNQGFEATADGAGKYAFPGLYPGLHQVQIASSYGTILREVRLAPSGSESKDFQYGIRSVIAGKVMNREGKPIENAQIQVDELEAWTDLEGRFQLQGVYPGDAVLYCKADGYAYTRQNLQVPDNAFFEPDTIKLVLAPGGELKGGVYPVGGTEPALLYLLPNHSTYDRSFPVEKFSGIEVPSGGSFTLKNVPSGVSMGIYAFHLRSAARPQMKPVHIRQKGENIVPIDFRFVSLRPLKGVVRDARTGNPVAGALVRSYVGNPYSTISQVIKIAGPGMGSFIIPMLPCAVKEQTTDPSGSFLLETGDSDLPTGPVSLLVEKEGFLPFEKSFAGPRIPEQEVILNAPADLARKSNLEIFFHPGQELELALTLNGAPKQLVNLRPNESYKLQELTTGSYLIEIKKRGELIWKEEHYSIAGTRIIQVSVGQ